MISLGLWVGSAAAAVSVGAVLEPEDVVPQYRLHAQEKGIQGPASELLCKPAAEGVQVCATVVLEKGWRYATHADQDVVAPTTDLSGPKAGFRSKEIDGMGRYWVRDLDDGLEGLVMVKPDSLKKLAPVPLVVAWPVPGVVIAWVPGNPSLDQVLSVGVAKMVAESNHPISSKMYRFEQGEWAVWGEAKRSAAD